MVASVQDRLSSAFKLAQQTSMANCGEALKPHAIVFESLVEAMATLKGLPDPEAGWLYSQSFWPQVIHDHEDAIENYKEMLRRIASGEESPDVLLKKRPPSSAAIGRMDAIFEVYPKCLVGKDRSRDWKILCFLASGLAMRKVAILTHSSKATVGDRRDLQLGQIAKKLCDLMPVVEEREAAPERPVYVMDRMAA